MMSVSSGTDSWKAFEGKPILLSTIFEKGDGTSSHKYSLKFTALDINAGTFMIQGIQTTTPKPLTSQRILSGKSSIRP